MRSRTLRSWSFPSSGLRQPRSLPAGSRSSSVGHNDTPGSDDHGYEMGTSTILVVDDERKIRDLVRSYLEREGYAVLVADTGERAIEAASRSDPDLVVLDLG